MTKEQSFLAKLGSSMSKNALMKLSNETKVQVTVGTITALCKDFHATGFADGQATLSFFENIFGK